MNRIAFLAAALSLLCAAGAPGARGAATRGLVLTSDYSTGTLSVVDLDTRRVTPDVAVVSSDPFERWYQGRLYVLNRFGFDNVQVIDPGQGYATVAEFSVGNGSNPQDIAFASPTKAYVSRLGSADLLVVDPSTGATRGTIPLAPWADADGIPEAAAMTMAGGRLLVALERLTNFAPADTGLVVVVDTAADTVVDADPATPGTQAVRLAGLNPSTAFAVLPRGGDAEDTHLLIGCTGRWGALDGGIDEIVVSVAGVARRARPGFLISEAALGGDVADVVVADSLHAYAVVSDSASNTSLVAWDPSRGTRTGTVYAPGGYSLSDVALDDRGELYACNSSFTSPGLQVFRAGSDEHLAGPIATGLPPIQIVFDSGEAAGGGGPAGARPSLAAPVPNPAQAPVSVVLDLPAPGRADVEVLDIFGRRVRALADRLMQSGPTRLEWDLLDAAGRRVRPGVYWFRAVTLQATVTRRFVVLD